jgi:Mn2+/Fe2+ NRAMP family transporter
MGAVVSEMSMIMDVMVWWGVDIVTCNIVVSLALMGLALTGSYEIPEKVGLAMGICQIAFFGTMFIANPKMEDVVSDLQSFPVGKGNFSSLVTANIGAVIMPWMLAYQQSSMARKGLSATADRETFMLCRMDAALGCFLTQGVVIAMILSVAAVVPEHSEVEKVDDLIDIFTPTLGSRALAKVVLTMGINGACMVAAIVVSMCAAWTMEEAMGQDQKDQDDQSMVPSCSLQGVVQSVKSRPVFYSLYTGILVFSFVSTVAFRDWVVQLNIYIDSLNGLLMPPVVFSLWYLASYNLPEEQRIRGFFKWSLFAVFLICSVFCLYSVFVG